MNSELTVDDGFSGPAGMDDAPPASAFQMRRDGLWVRDVSGHYEHRSAPFEVIGRAADPQSRGWAQVVRFRDHDGIEKTLAIPRAAMAGDGLEAVRQLLDEGLKILGRAGQRAVLAYIEAAATNRRALTPAAASEDWVRWRIA